MHAIDPVIISIQPPAAQTNPRQVASPNWKGRQKHPPFLFLRSADEQAWGSPRPLIRGLLSGLSIPAEKLAPFPASQVLGIAGRDRWRGSDLLPPVLGPGVSGPVYLIASGEGRSESQGNR